MDKNQFSERLKEIQDKTVEFDLGNIGALCMAIDSKLAVIMRSQAQILEKLTGEDKHDAFKRMLEEADEDLLDTFKQRAKNKSGQ